MTYNVTFEKNGVIQSNLIKTYHNERLIRLYFLHTLKADRVFSVEIATDDDMKPGKPVINWNF